MNLTHKVRDIRNFINAYVNLHQFRGRMRFIEIPVVMYLSTCRSRPENLSRPYTIGTTFPNRTLDDDTQTVEAAGLVNSVIVQRWVQG